jgi:hypothetical protein
MEHDEMNLRTAAHVTGKSTHILRRAMIAGRLAHRRKGEGPSSQYLTTAEALMAAGFPLIRSPHDPIEVNAADVAPGKLDDAVTIARLEAQLEAANDKLAFTEATLNAHIARTDATLDALLKALNQAMLLPGGREAVPTSAPDKGEEIQTPTRRTLWGRRGRQ